MANVFVSYRSIDRAAALRLVAEIRAAGHDVWLDVEKIDVGDSIIARIDEGLAGAGYVVLCYSSEEASCYVNREWYAALGRQLERRDIKILPIRLTGGSAPAILADIKFADLVSDWTAGVAELLRALR